MTILRAVVVQAFRPAASGQLRICWTSAQVRSVRLQPDREQVRLKADTTYGMTILRAVVVQAFRPAAAGQT